MKMPFLIITFIFLSGFAFAQEVPDIPEPGKDSATVALEKQNTMILVEQAPAFPGGESAFVRFVTNRTDIPELVTLFGFRGRIVLGFVVDASGTLKDIKAFSESGIGFEENMKAVISNSPRWKPAIQNGRPVDVKFTIPFKFDLPRTEISTNELKKSSYKFTFQIKDKIYDIKQAEALLGSKFSSAKIDYIKTFAEQPEENKKQKAYLIQIID